MEQKPVKLLNSQLPDELPNNFNHGRVNGK